MKKNRLLIASLLTCSAGMLLCSCGVETEALAPAEVTAKQDNFLDVAEDLFNENLIMVKQAENFGFKGTANADAVVTFSWNDGKVVGTKNINYEDLEINGAIEGLQKRDVDEVKASYSATGKYSESYSNSILENIVGKGYSNGYSTTSYLDGGDLYTSNSLIAGILLQNNFKSEKLSFLNCNIDKTLNIPVGNFAWSDALVSEDLPLADHITMDDEEKAYNDFIADFTAFKKDCFDGDEGYSYDKATDVYALHDQFGKEAFDNLLDVVINDTTNSEAYRDTASFLKEAITDVKVGYSVYYSGRGFKGVDYNLEFNFSKNVEISNKVTMNADITYSRSGSLTFDYNDDVKVTERDSSHYIYLNGRK